MGATAAELTDIDIGTTAGWTSSVDEEDAALEATSRVCLSLLDLRMAFFHDSCANGFLPPNCGP